MTPIDRILLTGAAGALGRRLRPFLKGHCRTLRATDVAPLDPAGEGEEVVQADLADPDAVLEMTRGVNAVVYMAGAGREGTYEEIYAGHMRGLYNVFEGARKNGVRRVVWASSIHAVGFHPFSKTLDLTERPRPDSTYGIAKAYGEAVAQCYFDKYGIEAVSMRICSCVPEPTERRHLSTWLSYEDLERLVLAGLTCTRPDHTIVYGVSANTHAAYDNSLANHLGYRPQDDAEAFRARIEAARPAHAPGDPAIATHGGPFSAAGHFEG